MDSGRQVRSPVYLPVQARRVVTIPLPKRVGDEYAKQSQYACCQQCCENLGHDRNDERSSLTCPRLKSSRFPYVGWKSDKPGNQASEASLSCSGFARELTIATDDLSAVVLH